MQIRVNEKRTHVVRNETVNGLNVSVLLDSSVNNTDIPDTQYMTGQAFDASNVFIDVILKRNGKIYNMISTNLAILAHFYSLTLGQKMWYKGKVLKKKGASEKQQVARNIFIPFFGHHNIKGTDEMVVTVQVQSDAFNTGVEASSSSVLVEPNQSIGYETAIYTFHEHTLQANMSNENVNLGDNVQRVAICSFERDPMKRIYKTASLASDRLDFTINEHEIAIKDLYMFPYNYADNLLSVRGVEEQDRYFPHSYIIHDKDEIDQAKLKVSLQPENIASSKNFICWVSFQTSREIIQKTVDMAKKHSQENANKVPDTI